MSGKSVLSKHLIEQLAALMDMVEAAFEDIGLSDLTFNERAVLLALSATARRESDGRLMTHSETARDHLLASKLSQPTFHLILRRLGKRGLVRKIAGAPGMYEILAPEAQSALADHEVFVTIAASREGS
jgi:DNA-binding MarR family transcriptional regulator